MPTLDFKKQNPTIKMLLIGSPGTGKTGALASLAAAGFNLRILDFDNGLSSIVNALKDTPAALKRVVYETCTDAMHSPAGTPVPKGLPKAWSSACALLTKWDKGDIKLGSPSNWTTNDILIIDSLTRMGQAALRRVLAINGRSGQQPYQQDYGQAMREQEDAIALLCSDDIPCHVIITSHITFIGGDEKTGSGGKGYPSALGSKLPPKVGSYFDTILMCDEIGSGAATKRKIRTVPFGDVSVKCPFDVPQLYPIETGLADFFKTAGAKPKL